MAGRVYYLIRGYEFHVAFFPQLAAIIGWMQSTFNFEPPHHGKISISCFANSPTPHFGGTQTGAEERVDSM
jgi:hypothetical protein